MLQTYKSIMPGFIFYSSNISLIFWITQNKTILVCILVKPFKSIGILKTAVKDLVFGCNYVNCQSRAMFAITGDSNAICSFCQGFILGFSGTHILIDFFIK